MAKRKTMELPSVEVTTDRSMETETVTVLPSANGVVTATISLSLKKPLKTIQARFLKMDAIGLTAKQQFGLGCLMYGSEAAETKLENGHPVIGVGRSVRLLLELVADEMLAK